MKKNQLKEFKIKEGSELVKELKNRRQALTRAQLEMATNKIKNTRLTRTIKREIAQILTVMNEQRQKKAK